MERIVKIDEITLWKLRYLSSQARILELEKVKINEDFNASLSTFTKLLPGEITKNVNLDTGIIIIEVPEPAKAEEIKAEEPKKE